MGKEEQLFQEFEKVSKSDWEEVVKGDLKGADYKEKLRWETLEGFSFEEGLGMKASPLKIEVLSLYERIELF